MFSRSLKASLCVLALAAAVPAAAQADYQAKIDDPITQDAHYKGQTPKVSVSFNGLDASEKFAQVYFTRSASDPCDAGWRDVPSSSTPQQLTLSSNATYKLKAPKLTKTGTYRLCVATFSAAEDGIEPSFTYEATLLKVTSACTKAYKARKAAKKRGAKAYKKATAAAKRAC